MARPVHLPATRLRNIRHDSDAGASAIPFVWLRDEAPDVAADLKNWLDVGDPDINELGDLPTYALAVLAQDEEPDLILKKEKGGIASMLCQTDGRWFAEDLRALLAYRSVFPRAVVIDHMRRLTMLHITLHLLQIFSAVVEITADPDATCGCGSDAQACRWMPELIADCGEDSRSAPAKLAEQSWAQIEETLSAYIHRAPDPTQVDGVCFICTQ